MAEPTTGQFSLTHHKYSQTPEGFNEYPEQLALPWLDLFSNENRRQLPLPLDWNNIRPTPERTNVPICLESLTDAQVDDIVANATSREDFHDYNWHASEHGSWGLCLCELRIITGTKCIPHLTKGDIAAPGAPPINKHWAWWIDCAPRGKLCPLARLRTMASLGGTLKEQACRDILIKPPPEHWVLAREKGDDVPGRAITDILLPGLCLACDDKTKCTFATDNQVFIDRLRGSLPWSESPWWSPENYRPKNKVRKHPTLRGGEWYHLDRLTQLGVPNKDIYLEKEKMTLAELHQLQADAAAAEAEQAEQPFA